MPAYTAPTFASPPVFGGGALVNQFSLSSVASTSLVSSPAAGATITWLQVPQDGKYSVQLVYGTLSGQPVRQNNVRLQVGNVTVTSLVQVAVVSTIQLATLILSVPSEQFIGLNVITGDAGATYTGSIIATKL